MMLGSNREIQNRTESYLVLLGRLIKSIAVKIWHIIEWLERNA